MKAVIGKLSAVSDEYGFFDTHLSDPPTYLKLN